MANAKLIKYLVEEIPVARFRSILADPKGAASSGGDWCGGDCGHTSGNKCGLKCAVPRGAGDVIDPEGRLGITQAELSQIRAKSPSLRQAVVKELQAQIDRLR